MSENLLKAGYPLTVYDISRPRVEELVQAGAVDARAVSEVAKRSDVVITMLSGPSEVEQVVLGHNGVLDGATEGSIIIDMTASPPSLARRISQQAGKKHVETLDAPVSGDLNATAILPVVGTLVAVSGPVANISLLAGFSGSIFASVSSNRILVASPLPPR